MHANGTNNHVMFLILTLPLCTNPVQALTFASKTPKQLCILKNLRPGRALVNLSVMLSKVAIYPPRSPPYSHVHRSNDSKHQDGLHSYGRTDQRRANL